MSLKFQSILLVDDHEFILRGLHDYIKSLGIFSEIKTVKSAEEALACITNNFPHVIITDVSLPGKSGIELIQIVKKKFPDKKIASLTQHTEIWIIKDLLQAKADAIVLKENEQIEIKNTLNALCENKNYFSPKVNELVMNEMSKTSKAKKSLLTHITKREQEILRLIADEHTSGEIAEKLFLSVKTVEVHRKNLFLKFDVKNSAGLVRKAVEMGFV